jgi:hypothetical protein
MALLALQSNANRMLSFNIRNDEYLPSTALPVFRSPEHAAEFRDSVLQLADTRSFLWTVSTCHRTNEATFATRFSHECPATTLMSSVRPKKFDVHDNELIDELILREIGCIIIDSYNLDTNQLVVNGSLWIPSTTIE